MTSASNAGGKARSAPSAAPETAAITANAMAAPAPSEKAQTNAAMASAIEQSQACRMPMRAARRTHKGSANAALMKYRARNNPLFCCMPRTSATKNRNKVAGIAEAMPLSANTSNRRRKRGLARTPGAPRAPRCAPVEADGAAGARPRVAAAQTASSGTKAKAVAGSPSSTLAPNSCGNNDARITPARPKASRVAVTVVRSAGLPICAPHAW